VELVTKRQIKIIGTTTNQKFNIAFKRIVSKAKFELTDLSEKFDKNSLYLRSKLFKIIE
jgi:hypothetical protein